jgi:hypothetical protein
LNKLKGFDILEEVQVFDENTQQNNSKVNNWAQKVIDGFVFTQSSDKFLKYFSEPTPKNEGDHQNGHRQQQVGHHGYDRFRPVL